MTGVVDSRTIVACRRLVPPPSNPGFDANVGVEGGGMIVNGASADVESTAGEPKERGDVAAEIKVSFGWALVRLKSRDFAFRCCNDCVGIVLKELGGEGDGDVGRPGASPEVNVGGLSGVIGAAGIYTSSILKAGRYKDDCNLHILLILKVHLQVDVRVSRY